ncbi:hypothetical protein M5689_004497 [Euphorbia peplus]|nr:hypothetical protein M5689_004497 [Euphorbia peplus]
MAGKASMIALFGFLGMLLLLSKPALSDNLTKVECPVVVKHAQPCLDFVTKKVPQPSKPCCTGVKQLKTMLKTKPDREAACECIKKMAPGAKIDPARAMELPKRCGAAAYYPSLYVPMDFNCKTIS